MNGMTIEFDVKEHKPRKVYDKLIKRICDLWNCKERNIRIIYNYKEIYRRNFIKEVRKDFLKMNDLHVIITDQFLKNNLKLI